MSLSTDYKIRMYSIREIGINYQSKHSYFKLHKLFNICNLHKTQLINIEKTQLI
jgi:hypothetical protein